MSPIHEAHFQDPNDSILIPSPPGMGLVSTILGSHPAWSTIGVDMIARSLEAGQLIVSPDDLSSPRHALYCWLSSYPSHMFRGLQRSWFQRLENLAPNTSEEGVRSLEVFLEKAGCDPLARDDSGIDCVDLACLHGRHRTIDRWFDAGLGLSLDNRRIFLPLQGADKEAWYAPLHLAAFAGSIEQMASLVRAGADPNICDSAGRTPLFHAKNADASKWLLDNGANAWHVDNHGLDAGSYWQSGVWSAKEADALVVSLPKRKTALTGKAALPAFMALAYQQPLGKLKPLLNKMDIELDSVHDGHGLLGHAALRVLDEQSSKAYSGSAWMGWLMQQPAAWSSISKEDAGLVIIANRITPDAAPDHTGVMLHDTLALLGSSVEECILSAIDAKPDLLSEISSPTYLGNFIPVGSGTSLEIFKRVFSQPDQAKSPWSWSPLWFKQQISTHPQSGIWRLPGCIEFFFSSALKVLKGQYDPSAANLTLGRVKQALSSLIEAGARSDNIQALADELAAVFTKRGYANGQQASEISGELVAMHDAALLSDRVNEPTSGPSKPPRPSRL